MTGLTRRQFLKLSGTAAASVTLLGGGCTARPAETTVRREPPVPTGDQAYLAVARGVDPAAITRAALAALGGIERFVRSGDEVIIKPNICVDYHPPEYAATTNPTVVATLVTLCLGAGARRVRVMDTPFGGTPESAYSVSGIGEAVRAAGGEMEVMSPVKFAEFTIPDGRDITAWEVYRDVLGIILADDVPDFVSRAVCGDDGSELCEKGAGWGDLEAAVQAVAVLRSSQAFWAQSIDLKWQFGWRPPSAADFPRRVYEALSLALDRPREELQSLVGMLIEEWKRQAGEVLSRFGYEVLGRCLMKRL
jgi:hypothetical protein